MEHLKNAHENYSNDKVQVEDKFKGIVQDYSDVINKKEMLQSELN